MKRFLLNILAFSGIVCLLAVVVVCVAMPRIKLYTAPFSGWYQRCMSVHQSCDKPRLVLVGGSNLACGIDTGLLSKELDDRYKVVNLGFHAGLGIGVHLDLIDGGLKSGDCVVLMVEYNNWSRWNGALPNMVFRCDVQGRNLFTSMYDSKWGTVDLCQCHHYVMEKWRKLVGGSQLFAASADGESEKRQVVSNEATDDVHPDPHYVSLPVFSTSRFMIDNLSLSMIRKLKESYDKRGVRLLLSCPSYDVRHYDLHSSEIDDIYRQIVSKVAIEQISSPGEYSFPLSEMGNTEWHVNRIGREIMTRRLGRDLKCCGL